ncbi:acyl-CoA dehydrogenase [Sulfitobacter sp. KE34]|nr:acyl-CoA dehydrogenase [Sulfitobacter sp. KE12]MDF3355632.1 acyl-CoA dehydrogenase [Sulfitobacter sp. KE27]MDF3359314.1 acyl-CoA dehydrogenase [Sulfitobacter sp. KE33]MDF3366739.1 acyl-CoA dehydrogenase [Sulfitobacter sp. Ks34]MDF3370314.1 acyl-CoA dehydrogenase [Sulfitobacter sp. Ks43]MDF3373942.1 acyl-CoA dehydrogenase [Sulfitobacter sp. KS8]MDF3377584.1 acyl-CoA dehydrogenase [Sulfitobacter sp. KE37]MDF3381295.1 acyl-CoA dehydrogenase [Sulfitobacter sp. KE32]MDF3395173.1 acyl-CoA dehy
MTSDLQAQARDLAETEFRPLAAEVDQTEQYPWQSVEKLNKAGFMGMTLPTEYGGRGLSYADVVVVIEEMARCCGTMGRITVEANMGGVGAIMRYGTDAQKRMSAALILDGDKPAICITEPDAGSAATEMTTTAVKKGDKYIINGKKHWITGGGVSRLHLVFARLIEDGQSKGIAGFIAVRDETPGLIVGRREPAMGLRGIPETEIIFEDMEVPEDMIVIPPEGVARGFAGLMRAYNAQRVGAGTVALGLAQGAYEKAVSYALEREQFGRPIGEFQGLQWMVADMSISIAAARALLRSAAKTQVDGFPDIRAAAQAKIMAAETAQSVTNAALQMHGAMGYSRNLPLERMVRDARMFSIAGGTTQILRTQVAGSILGIKTPQTRNGYFNNEAAAARVGIRAV